MKTGWELGRYCVLGRERLRYLRLGLCGLRAYGLSVHEMQTRFHLSRADNESHVGRQNLNVFGSDTFSNQPKRIHKRF